MPAFEEVADPVDDTQADLPHFYANSFIFGLSNADFNMTLLRNGRPQAVVNMSYTTLKTVALTFNQAIAQLEAATGREIMTVDVVAEALSRPSKGGGE